uniref:Uncharacterized protein n=1 Tax=Anguilla anguilla TaxID=7936 RepID=A0A0E9RKH9_ANGAN
MGSAVLAFVPTSYSIISAFSCNICIHQHWLTPVQDHSKTFL